MATTPEILELKKLATPDTYSRFRPLSHQRTCPCVFDTHKEAQVGVFQKEGLWLFNCPACKKGGDILTFIQKTKSCNFPEALRLLREALGKTIASEVHVAFEYNPALAATRLPEVMEFLLNRGIDEATARKHNVGAVDHPSLGLSVAIPYGVNSENGLPIVKFRAVNPRLDENGKRIKFRHLAGADTNDQLYGWPLDIAQLEHDPYLWIVESELDKLTLETYGKNAMSVGSATGSLVKGKLKYSPEIFATLAKLDIKILIGTDMDEAGSDNAAAWGIELPPHQAFRVKWPYTKGPEGKPSNDPKDIGDLYALNEFAFFERICELEKEALNRPPLWRAKFHTVDELPEGDIDFLIKDTIPEGVSFIGAGSGVGKTWYALSLARALTTGKKFLGIWDVPKPVNVLYLCPEMNAKPFKRRCKLMGIKDRFFCQTVSDGVPISLDDPNLKTAIRDLSPVIFLDTAIRFSEAEDENAASDNARGLAEDIKALQYLGAPSVICLHHRGKASIDSGTMTLENVLRGTGDFGAMCDAVWGLEYDRGPDSTGEYLKKSKRLVRIHVGCVKARDFESPAEFVIQLSDYIDTIGDFGVLDQPAPGSTAGDELSLLQDELRNNPMISERGLQAKTGVGRNRISKILEKAGWEHSESGWRQSTGTLEPDETAF
jgi:hypothetical protein